MHRTPHIALSVLVVLVGMLVTRSPAAAQQKPNIILILSDDFGYGDSGPYGGGPGRGTPTPSLDRLSDEGMTFFSFYAQPSCTPGRAAIQTGRIPNRSGMTTVAFQGQGGGLPKEEWTLALAGVKLPDKDRAGQPLVFDSYDMSPILFGTGKSARTSWFYFTENELSPGAARVGNYKAVFNLRGDDVQPTGGLAVDTNLGWKGAEKYVATVPQVFDLWQDPQERYDIFMNNFTERTWTLVTIAEAIKGLMKTYVTHPPRKLQSESYSGPITLSNYEKFQWIREQLGKEGISLPLPSVN